jgi:UDP-GlcNAc:undecaprenyl-phosphate GlcNAc-1-phosphate transferase
MGGFLMNTWVTGIDVPVLDAAFAVPAFAVVFSMILVAGLINAFNIIDGFNGLAGGVASLILLGITYVAFKAGDPLVLAMSVTAIGAIAGFMLFNFPRGLIYLGDGGAYLLGFWIGELLILLVVRNPQVSPWFPLLLCSYPVCEMLFSIYRRIFFRRAHPHTPDMAHLHHLIYKRVVRWLVGPGLIGPARTRQCADLALSLDHHVGGRCARGHILARDAGAADRLRGVCRRLRVRLYALRALSLAALVVEAARPAAL